MMQLTVVKTFLSRFFILFLSFGLVIFTTNIWGSEGKGLISIVIANAAIISFFSGIFAGGSSSYFATRFKVEEIMPWSYLWAIIIGVAMPFIFSFANIQGDYLFYLIGISVFSALLATNVSLFIGKKDIKRYNIYTVLQQLLHVVFLLIIFFILKITDVTTYFSAQILCLGTLFCTSLWHVMKNIQFKEIRFSKDVFISMFEYGWKTQLSAFIQFLNYRLSFYFLEYYEGLAVVGIFSVGITFAEAIWTITRSMAVVLYSEVINSKSREESIQKTKNAVKITLWITVIFLAAVLIIPDNMYSWIFGEDFGQTRKIVFFLSMGILAIATSDMVGHYFSGIRQLNILNIKSLVGLFFTVILSIVIIPTWGILGACMVTTVSYIASATLLFYKFYKNTDFKLKYYIVTKNEIQNLFKSVFKR